jgi:hypothetical protein
MSFRSSLNVLLFRAVSARVQIPDFSMLPVATRSDGLQEAWPGVFEGYCIKP